MFAAMLGIRDPETADPDTGQLADLQLAGAIYLASWAETIRRAAAHLLGA